MIGRSSLWLPLAILLVLAGLSAWLERSVQLPEISRQADRAAPEGIMENFDALRTDPAGRPQYRLLAKRLRHYSGSRLTEMEFPHFIQLDEQQGEVSATADQATVSADGNEIDLAGNVNVTRAARPGQSAMTLRTARLLVFPERNLLRAPGTVDIQDATTTVHAGAMEYDAKQRVIKLTGRVQAHLIHARN